MPEPFGTLLRRYRVGAALTQERLAERAGISAAGVAALEAGRRRTPRLSTVALLIDALELDASERVELLAAASTGSLSSVGAATTNTAARWPADALLIPRRYSFVGRPAELACLSSAWSQRMRVVLLYGEAGVGKTRLAGEFASALAGATVLWGRCTAERLGAYEPFVDPLRSAVRRHGDTAVVGQGELVRLLPELTAAQHGTTVPSRAEPEVERRLLFEAVGMLLADLGPVLLVLDDLQWADPGSFALLAYLASAPYLTDLVLVGAVRSTDLVPAAAASLSSLRRGASVEHINLAGLGMDDVARLVELVAGGEASRDLVDAVALATDGNPFFVEELTEHLLRRGYDGGPGSNREVPDSVRATLAHRFEGLSADARALLRAGAVLGREFDPRLAGQLAELQGPQLFAATEDALLSALVTERSARTLSFSHALVRASIYEGISALRRAEIHRRAALALEQAAPTTSGEISELVRHWAHVAAVEPAASTFAARWAVRAGDMDLASAAVEEAISHYQQARSFCTAPTAEQADTLIRLGSALSASGRGDEADDQFRAALRLSQDLGDAELVARAALGLSATVRYGHSDAERVTALEMAIEQLGPADGVLRPAALAMLMRQLGFDPSPEASSQRQKAAALVLQAVSRPDLPEELLLALGAARDSIPVDDPAALRQLTRQMIEVATARRDLRVLANAWYGQAWSTLELGDPAGWAEARAGYASVAEELRLPFELALTATMEATAALIEGRYADAEYSAERALAQATATGDENASAVYLTNGALRGFDLGQAADVLALMRAVQDDYVNIPTFTAGLTLAAALAGDLTSARQLLDDQATSGFESIRRDAEWLPVIGMLCHACSLVGHSGHGERLRQLLAASPARTVRVGPLAGWWGATDHHLGSISRMLGHLDEAEHRLRAALSLEQRMGARPFCARTQIELARVLEQRGGPASRREAGELQDEARATSQALRAPGLVPFGT